MKMMDSRCFRGIETACSKCNEPKENNGPHLNSLDIRGITWFIQTIKQGTSISCFADSPQE